MIVAALPGDHQCHYAYIVTLYMRCYSNIKTDFQMFPYLFFATDEFPLSSESFLSPTMHAASNKHSVWLQSTKCVYVNGKD